MTEPAADSDDQFFSKPVRGKVRAIWQHRFINANILLSHLVGALIIIGSMELLELVLTHGKPVKVFEGLPYEFEVRWVINAADICILLAFLIRGVIATWTAEAE